MIKIKITAMTEKAKQEIENMKKPTGGGVIQKMAGIQAEQISDEELLVTISKFSDSFIPMFFSKYETVFEKLGLKLNEDYKMEVI